MWFTIRLNYPFGFELGCRCFTDLGLELPSIATNGNQISTYSIKRVAIMRLFYTYRTILITDTYSFLTTQV